MPPADFLEDVALPGANRAEELVFRAYKDTGHNIRDCRHQKTCFDFQVWWWDDWLTLDVKYDRYIESTGRVLFEKFHEPANFLHKNLRSGWGFERHPKLLAIVGLSLQKALVYQLDEIRTFVTIHTASGKMPQGWVYSKPFNLRGGYWTHGYAIPISELSACAIEPVELLLDSGLRKAS